LDAGLKEVAIRVPRDEYQPCWHVTLIISRKKASLGCEREVYIRELYFIMGILNPDRKKKNRYFQSTYYSGAIFPV
jgi:hypothetical protein